MKEIECQIQLFSRNKVKQYQQRQVKQPWSSLLYIFYYCSQQIKQILLSLHSTVVASLTCVPAVPGSNPGYNPVRSSVSTKRHLSESIRDQVGVMHVASSLPRYCKTTVFAQDRVRDLWHIYGFLVDLWRRTSEITRLSPYVPCQINLLINLILIQSVYISVKYLYPTQLSLMSILLRFCLYWVSRFSYSCVVPTGQVLFSLFQNVFYILDFSQRFYFNQIILTKLLITTQPRIEPPTLVRIQTPEQFSKMARCLQVRANLAQFGIFSVSDLVFHFSYRHLFQKFSKNFIKFLVS
ncbi:Hypothetical_protein [Hexamita inflata]|uniref:Hypothetical_protein n=1 Tax=Hexamita inflata TaxID=28002 RepID=A0AA86PYJ4_9EUKA|nr:Hypothetical protein HINF_LOCUS36365 [Hexamita inflata]